MKNTKPAVSRRSRSPFALRRARRGRRRSRSKGSMGEPRLRKRPALAVVKRAKQSPSRGKPEHRKSPPKPSALSPEVVETLVSKSRENLDEVDRALSRMTKLPDILLNRRYR